MFTIGHLSMIARISVRTLRKYHEQGLLVPDYVDDETGYRYYREAAIERARVIKTLRSFDFPLKAIRAMLQEEERQSDVDLLDSLLQRRDELALEIQQTRAKRRALQAAIAQIKRSVELPEVGHVMRKTVPATANFLALRRKGRWEDIGECFGRVGRAAGRLIAGPALSLCYDGEYREEDADYAAGFPVKRAVESDGLVCATLPALDCISLVHRGPYAELGRSYERLFDFANARKLQVTQPSREVYIKGPGMIFRGNPDRYLTEIQLPVLKGP